MTRSLRLTRAQAATDRADRAARAALRRRGHPAGHRPRHRRGQGPRREMAHAHRLRRADRPGLRRRRASRCCWSATRPAMVVYGHDTTIPVTVDDLLPLTAAVVRGTSRAMVVADLPFGSYQASPAGGAGRGHQVPEGGRRARGQARGRPPGAAAGRGAGRGRHPGDGAPRPDPAVGQRVRRLPGAGPRRGRRAAAARRQGAAGGRRVRGGAGGVPAELAARVTAALAIPTIGIGAGPDCDAQVLVWQDMAGLSPRTAEVRQAVRGRGRGAARAPRSRSPTRWSRGGVPGRRSTPTAE